MTTINLAVQNRNGKWEAVLSFIHMHSEVWPRITTEQWCLEFIVFFFFPFLRCPKESSPFFPPVAQKSTFFLLSKKAWTNGHVGPHLLWQCILRFLGQVRWRFIHPWICFLWCSHQARQRRSETWGKYPCLAGFQGGCLEEETFTRSRAKRLGINLGS